ncbi:Glucan 1,3-beta-glucosidase, partial [Neolecta irregularis DAH-3]
LGSSSILGSEDLRQHVPPLSPLFKIVLWHFISIPSTMKFYAPIATFLPIAFAEIMGFNVGQQKPDGTCKSADDYAADFNRIYGPDKVFKIFSPTDSCGQNSLFPLLDAAKQADGKVLVGLWAVGSGFDAEKRALWDAVQVFGGERIVGVVVGSESLYRSQFQGTNEITPQELANRIYDVKGMIQGDKSSGGLGLPHIPVGTADTWNALVDGRNTVVLQALNTVWVNAFPYWQGYAIENGPQALFDAINSVKSALSAPNPSASIAVGETGWPTEGKPFGSSVPSLENSRAFWVNAFCKLRGMGMDAYWFEAFDEPQKTDTTHNTGVEKYWGVYDSNRQTKFDISC